MSQKFVIERVLGSGGMGVVYAARHRDLGERVAIKTVRREIAGRTDVERLRREGKAAARVKSERIVRATDIGELEDGTPFVVMEYVDGETLSQHVKQHGQPGFQRAVDIVLQICEGVASAHAAGIVHRDLKPSNVLLARMPHGELSVKVLDFGVAMSSRVDVPTLTRASSALGSPRYMSPEQVRDAHRVDTRTDVWSIGVILYELLSKAHPFDADSIAGVLAAISVDEPIRLASRNLALPRGLVRAVDACIEKDREKRTQSVADLAAKLEPFGTTLSRGAAARVRAALGDGGVVAHRGSTLEKTAEEPDASTGGEKRPIVAWAVLGVAAVVALGLAAFALAPRPESPGVGLVQTTAVLSAPSTASLPEPGASAPSSTSSRREPDPPRREPDPARASGSPAPPRPPTLPGGNDDPFGPRK